MADYSDIYVETLDLGPFDGQVDPWAEDGRYFQQIHSGMIEYTLQQIKYPLAKLGYVAGKETSLQIMQGREPDVFVLQETHKPVMIWNYAQAAETVQAAPGTVTDREPDLQHVSIFDAEDGELVTIIEMVSPRNKTHHAEILAYRERRDMFIYEKSINVVEVDPTRSVKRLLQNSLTERHAYHIAIYLPAQLTRVIEINFGEGLPRYALPLRGEVIPIETHLTYQQAYRFASIAAQIRKTGHYTEDHLPFPSLLTETQRREALQRIETWEKRLSQLREGD